VDRSRRVITWRDLAGPVASPLHGRIPACAAAGRSRLPLVLRVGPGELSRSFSERDRYPIRSFLIFFIDRRSSVFVALGRSGSP
jgi:hypothetical protein